MRFDDRLETVMRIDPTGDHGRAAIWRQLVDLLSQSGNAMSPAAAARGLAALSLLRRHVPLAVRVAAVRAVAARCSFAPLVTLLAADDPTLVVALMDRVQLDVAGWLAIMPDLGPLARSRLRRRNDLGEPVTRALGSYGTTDFALPNASPAASMAAHAPPVDVGVPTAPTNIGDLVRRIEEYRSRQPLPVATPLAFADEADDDLRAANDGDAMRFRADTDGIVRIVTGLPRGPFVGLTIAEPALAGEPGFDAGVARAFNKRGAISGGRLWLAGDPAYAGDWLIDAVPRFDQGSGRFEGYDGELRRPRLGETAQSLSGASIVPDAAPERPMAMAMRQMVHELRSPLNAINGFAQLIDGQYFGPVSHRYRELARAIIADAGMLAGTFEDIDIAARLDLGSIAHSGSGSDLGEAIDHALTELEAMFIAQRASLKLLGTIDGHPIALAQADARRLVLRFIGAVAASAQAGEELECHVEQHPQAGFVRLRLQRPRAIRGMSEAALADYDGGELLEGKVTALGLGFALTLATQLAAAHGGQLVVEPDQCILNLPILYGAQDRSGAIG